MKFCWTTIMAKNMEESLRFYQDIVGLALQRRFQPAPGQEIAFLGEGETQVELITNQKKVSVEFGQDISLGFATESLDALTETLGKHGIAVHSGPFQPSPELRFLYALDPNGLKIQFVEFAQRH
ncbi:MAG: VOC family protein [Spirochaetales bacterium]|nr:MAG: VOC family protein [Spirochaetales bacterium]